MIKENYTIIPLDIEKAGNVSSSIKKILQKIAIKKDIIRRVSIATYEAEINIVIHSHGGICQFSYDDDVITVTFTDTGPGILDIEEAFKEGYSTASIFAINNGFGAGMGLSNIRKSCDNLIFESSFSGTYIKMTFNIKGEKNEE